MLYDWSRLALVLFLLIIHTKIKSKNFFLHWSPLSFVFLHFFSVQPLLFFHNELLRSLLLIGSLRHLLYLWIQFACLISFNVPHLAFTFFFFSEAVYDPCLSGALPHVPTRLVSGDVISTFHQFLYKQDIK